MLQESPKSLRCWTVQSLNMHINNSLFKVRAIRRHCCALMIKLSSKFPAILYSTFQENYTIYASQEFTNIKINKLFYG